MSDIDDDIPCFLLEGDTITHQDNLDFISQDYAEHDAMLIANERDDSDLLLPITAEELIRVQAQHDFCRKIRQMLNEGEEIPFAEDDVGYLTRTVESFPQIVIPSTLRPRVLHIQHHAKLSAHPGGRKLYTTLRRDFWPSMAVDAYGTVKNCVTCAKNRVTLRKNSKNMHLFPAKAPLEFVSIDLLGERITTSQGNRFLLVITDRFPKLVRTVPLKRITAAVIAHEFVRHWVLVYGPPALLLSDTGGQFTACFFKDV